MTFLWRPVRIGAVAGAALLGTTLVSAQQMPQQVREPPSTRDKDSKDLRGPQGARPDIARPKGIERPDMSKDRNEGAEHPDEERAKGAERPDMDKDRPKGAERPGKDRAKGAERPDMDKDRPKGAARPDKDRAKGAERLEPDQPKGSRLSEQQRTQVGAQLRQTQVERARVQVRLDIGSRVPRSVRLRPLPPNIFAAAPAYRGHSYFVLKDDTIVIVDTRSYVVVDVIPATTHAAGLTLSPEQMHLIKAMVPNERTADVRFRLALGAEVPAHVELLPFPAEIRAQVPEVEGYRYVVATGGDVVIVDPQNRDIALVITD